MNPEQLIKHLILSGIPEAQARKVVESLPADPGVDADKLSKALDELKGVFLAENDTDDGAEKLQKALNRADTADAARSAVAELGDALLAEVREQNEALCKALLHMGETIIDISTANAVLREENTETRDLLKSITEALNVPLAPRSVRTSLEDVIPAPGERLDPNAPVQDSPASMADRLNKAIEIETALPTTTGGRRRELMAAASAMNSGMPLEVIAKSYGLNIARNAP